MSHVEQPSGWHPWWDEPIYGAKNIGAVVNLEERPAFHALVKKLLDADKFGGRWRSTRRRLLKPAPGLAPPSSATPTPSHNTDPAGHSQGRSGTPPTASAPAPAADQPAEA
jgi:hypothetical protein